MNLKNNIIIGLLLFITAIAPSCNEGEIKQNISDDELKSIVTRTEARFDEYCAGCHGNSIKSFAEEDWKVDHEE